LNIEELFTTLVEKRCSSLHFVPGSPIMTKTGDTLTPLDDYVLSPQDTLTIAEGVMNDSSRAEFEEKLQCVFAFSVPGLSRFRISCCRQRGSVSLVIATNPPCPPSLEELGLPDQFKKLALESDNGLILITGQKGAGKAHTLAALVRYLLEQRPCKIISLEDPIDFLQKNGKGVIVQREIGTDVQNYDDALHSVGSQEADVIVITGADEFSIVERCLNLAAAGNLVIATSASATAQVAIEKMIELYPPHLQTQARTLLSVSMRAVLCQTLCCRAAGDGYAPAFELMIGTPALKKLIREGKLFEVQSLMSTTGREAGMMTQETSLRALVRKNLITEQEGFRRAIRQEEFRKVLSLPY
jgi:twitching motility protein PilT